MEKEEEEVKKNRLEQEQRDMEEIPPGHGPILGAEEGEGKGADR